MSDPFLKDIMNQSYAHLTYDGVKPPDVDGVKNYLYRKDALMFNVLFELCRHLSYKKHNHNPACVGFTIKL